MSSEQAFLADILANPRDDAPRLIYADWLADHGEPERVEFIRIESELATFANPRSEALGSRCDLLGQRALALKLQHWPRWAKDLPGINRFRHGADGPEFARSINGQEIDVRTRRGFVEFASCPLQLWLGLGPALVGLHPLREVRAVDRKPLRSSRGDSPWSWVTADSSAVGPIVRESTHWVPGDISVHLAGLGFRRDGSNLHFYEFATEADAHFALSTACLAWAKGEARARGLWPLSRKEPAP